MSSTVDVYEKNVSYGLSPSHSALPVPSTAPAAPLSDCPKRFFDLLVAVSLLVLLLPLLLLVAALIAVGDRGPILYTQTRIGRNGRPFRFYKFRSMVADADSDAVRARLAARNEASGPIFKMRRDPRVTPIGRILRRYSLDELPQLYNVLKGDMSLVGPRPHRPCEVAQYLPAHQVRLLVQPGLICLREVSGRSDLSFERWLELDLEYIRQRSMITDLKILCRAVPAVLRGQGAY
jgi:lipopolysaccharide/colanic/teichoic acid biosynthesis glycosyltransferase